MLQKQVIEEIITKTVLNDNTGDFETQDFKRVYVGKEFKGDWNMVYVNSYDNILVQCIKSELDMSIFISIRNEFTYKKVEVSISSSIISKREKVSKSKVDTMIKRMVDSDFLLRIRRGVYRINPFIYLPYRSDAQSLQNEWNEIKGDLFEKYNKSIIQ